jgi:hypothetical protein
MNGLNVSNNTSLKGTLYVSDNVSLFNGLNVSGVCSISQNLLIAGNVISQSDRKIKKNIKYIDNCLERINNISGYEYTRTDLNDAHHIGLIAQEVEENFPELVTESNNIKGINYQGFIAILLNCIKELNEKIEKIKSL